MPRTVESFDSGHLVGRRPVDLVSLAADAVVTTNEQHVAVRQKRRRMLLTVDRCTRRGAPSATGRWRAGGEARRGPELGSRGGFALVVFVTSLATYHQHLARRQERRRVQATPDRQCRARHATCRSPRRRARCSIRRHRSRSPSPRSTRGGRSRCGTTGRRLADTAGRDATSCHRTPPRRYRPTRSTCRSSGRRARHYRGCRIRSSLSSIQPPTISTRPDGSRVDVCPDSLRGQRARTFGVASGLRATRPDAGLGIVELDAVEDRIATPGHHRRPRLDRRPRARRCGSGGESRGNRSMSTTRAPGRSARHSTSCRRRLRHRPPTPRRSATRWPCGGCVPRSAE